MFKKIKILDFLNLFLIFEHAFSNCSYVVLPNSHLETKGKKFTLISTTIFKKKYDQALNPFHFLEYMLDPKIK